MLYKHLSFEIPLFLFFFALKFCEPIKSNLNIFRTCYVTLSYNKTECSLLGSQNFDNETAKLEKIVEPYAAVVTMVNVLIEGFCSVTLCLFLGPWSDRFGRKPVLVAPLIGYFLFYLLTAVYSSLEVSPWFSLICLLALCSTGGPSTLMTAVLCYITDLTQDEQRGMKMGVLEAVMYLGDFLGTITSSYVFVASNYSTIFTIGAVCSLIGVLYTIFLIPESLENQQPQGRHFFDLSNIRSMVGVTFKKRSNYARFTLLSCCVIIIISGVIYVGNETLMFLFLREKFHWSLHKFTLFSAYTSVVLSFGTFLGVYIFHKLLKVSETILVLVSLISSLSAALLMAMAQSDWLIYLVPIAQLLSGVSVPMVKLLISKIIPKDEFGKIFALVTASQFLFGVLGSPIFTYVYKKSIEEDPGIFCFVVAGMVGVQICILMSVIVVRTVNVRVYNVLMEEE